MFISTNRSLNSQIRITRVLEFQLIKLNLTETIPLFSNKICIMYYIPSIHKYISTLILYIHLGHILAIHGPLSDVRNVNPCLVFLFPYIET